jgi:hypothetical protein
MNSHFTQILFLVSLIIEVVELGTNYYYIAPQLLLKKLIKAFISNISHCFTVEQKKIIFLLSEVFLFLR